MFFSFLWRKLHPQDVRYFLKVLKDIETQTPKEQIIQYDIVYHKILQKLGYTWSFGDILKRNPKEIINIQEMWELHKLRNRLVHELKVKQENLWIHAKNYEDNIKRLLKKVGKIK